MTLKLIQQPGFYDQLAASAKRLADGLTQRPRKPAFILRRLGGRHVRPVLQRRRRTTTPK
jgi:hypothetical protein